MAGSFYWTSWVAVHHCAAGAAMLPVVVHGWDAAGPDGQKVQCLRYRFGPLPRAFSSSYATPHALWNMLYQVPTFLSGADCACNPM